MKLKLLICLFCIFTTMGLCAADCQLDYKPQCAQYSVHHCCRLLGVPVSLRKVCELLPSKRQGETLLEIGDTFETLGLKYLAEEVSFEELIVGSFPIIAHVIVEDENGLTKSHFVVIESFGPAGLKVHDSTRRGRWSRHDFLKRWNGIILRVIKPEKYRHQKSFDGPCVEFDTLFIDAGDIPQTQNQYNFVFSLKNTGNANLHINKIKTSCACTVVDTYSRVLTPDQEEKIEIKYVFEGGVRGKIAQSAVVMTDDPKYPISKLTVIGNGRVEVKIAPKVIALGRIVLGSSATTQCFISYTGERPFDVISAKSSFNKLSFAIKPLTPQLYKQANPNTSNLVLSECTNRYILEGVIDTNGLEIRKYSTDVELTTSLSEASVLKIPVKFEVIPQVAVFPSKLFLGEVSEGYQIRKQLVVKSCSSSKMKIVKVNTPSADIKVMFDRGVFDKESVVALSGTIEDPTAIVGREIVIFVEEIVSNETHIIPLSIIVRPQI